MLEKIALEGCIVTIDAMGCQYAIAEQIVSKKADYVFSLKGNQENLHETVKEYWEGLNFNAPASAQERHIRFNSTSTHDGEDACRIRTDKGPENMAFIRKIALTLARSDKESKSSMVGRLKQIAWDNDYLEQMLFNSDFGANPAAG
ncbi:hypothetical protein FACS1894137_15620 [Spirochaetia bacterium]|nr:hypothetical protein FACS1894137_15620 [Spirochaetia bacterium]